MTLRTTLLGSAALFLLAGTAQAGHEGLHGTYFAIEGGANWLQDNGFADKHVNVSSSSTTFAHHSPSFDTGWAILGSVGYAFENNWRVEVEGGYRHNGLDKVVCVWTAPSPWSATYYGGGEMNEWTIMANVLYDFHLGKRWSLSVGAGVGADDAHFEVKRLGISDSDWRFAWQGLVGINYAIGDQTQLFLNYRYLNVDAPSYSSGTPTGWKSESFDDDLQKHTVSLGLRFFLVGEEPPPPPPPHHEEPPPPPPPSHPKQFIVFFGFNKYNLTAEAQRVVEEAAAAAKQYGAASIEVVGHTDTSGSPGYNQKLSEHRAQTVRNALEALGVPEDNIHISGKGESELMIETGDGVKEPQNRRATIDME